MSGTGNKYLLVSLPNSISPSNDRDEALTALRAAVSTDFGTTWPFLVPQFKIGALDALIQQADDLAKLSADCEVVVGKVADSLSSILEGDQDKIAQQKTVNNSAQYRRPFTEQTTDRYHTEPIKQYLHTFSWNKVKYRSDKPIAELVDTLRKVNAIQPKQQCSC